MRYKDYLSDMAGAKACGRGEMLPAVDALKTIARRCDEMGIVFDGQEVGDVFRRLRDYALKAVKAVQHGQ